MVTMNRFTPGVTDTICVHAGRFHADDAMFVAIATVACSKSRIKATVRRLNDVEGLRGENIIVGDVGRGVYDHHLEEDNLSVGAQNNTEDHMSAACGLLYEDVKHILFPEKRTETQALFEALIDIIEHCDNTMDNNTFSDSINLMSPPDVDKTDERAQQAFRFCTDVVRGFMSAHVAEKSGKVWNVPTCNQRVLPGLADLRKERYIKPPKNISNKYKYISFNDKAEIKLRSMHTFSLAINALPYWKRAQWKEFVEQCDTDTQNAIQQRAETEWPEAIKNMKNLTIVLDNYFPWAKYIKDINAVFIVQASQRGGYSVSPIKTNNGKYRCPISKIKNAAGCTYVANDGRFLSFETKEMAIETAYTAGESIMEYLESNGLEGYRYIYGGIGNKGYSGQFFQDVISEDIALRCYIRNRYPDMTGFEDSFINELLEKIKDNQYMLHCFYSHVIKKDADSYEWDNEYNILEPLKGKDPKFLTEWRTPEKEITEN